MVLSRRPSRTGRLDDLKIGRRACFDILQLHIGLLRVLGFLHAFRGFRHIGVLISRNVSIRFFYLAFARGGRRLVQTQWNRAEQIQSHIHLT